MELSFFFVSREFVQIARRSKSQHGYVHYYSVIPFDQLGGSNPANRGQRVLVISALGIYMYLGVPLLLH